MHETSCVERDRTSVPSLRRYSVENFFRRDEGGSGWCRWSVEALSSVEPFAAAIGHLVT